MKPPLDIFNILNDKRMSRNILYQSCSQAGAYSLYAKVWKLEFGVFWKFDVLVPKAATVANTVGAAKSCRTFQQWLPE